MRTPENRDRYDRSALRDPGDLTDAAWALVAPLIPPSKRCGSERTVDLRAAVDGLRVTGCRGRALPTDLPPRATVHGYLDLRDDAGTLARIHHTLFVARREQAGRAASPTALARSDSASSRFMTRHREQSPSARAPAFRRSDGTRPDAEAMS